MPRKFVKMTDFFLGKQKGKTYFYDDKVDGTNDADRIVRRGFGILVPDPNAETPEPVEEVEVEVEEPRKAAKALGDTTDDPDRKELNEYAKELGIPNYWLMKEETLIAAIEEREDEVE